MNQKLARKYDNGLIFSPNGSGVHLPTKYGNLHFSSEEFAYYQVIYIVITAAFSSPVDQNESMQSKDIGRKGGKSIQGSSQLLGTLIRTDISLPTLEKVIHYAIDCFQSPTSLGGPTNESQSSKHEPTIFAKGSTSNLSVSSSSNTSPRSRSSSTRTTPKSAKLKSNKASPETRPSSSKSLTSILSIMSQLSTNETEFPSLSIWLTICKIIAAVQNLHSLPNRQLLKRLHTTYASTLKATQPIRKLHSNNGSLLFGDDPEALNTSQHDSDVTHLDESNIPDKIGFANFNFHRVPHKFAGGTFRKEFSIELSGWQLCGDDQGFSSTRQHVKFKLVSTAQLVCSAVSESTVDSSLKSSPTSLKSSLSSTSMNHAISGSFPLAEKNVVERRYSDFVALVDIMHKNHKGCVIPPIPSKQWSHNFLTAPLNPIAVASIRQRMKELQLFLADLLQHPMLKYSFELQVFLESSAAGFKSFVEMHHTMLGEEGEVIVRPQSSSLNNLLFATSESLASTAKKATTSSVHGVSNIITSSISTGAKYVVANSPVTYGYVSSLWGFVAKTVPSLASPTSISSPPNLFLSSPTTSSEASSSVSNSLTSSFSSPTWSNPFSLASNVFSGGKKSSNLSDNDEAVSSSIQRDTQYFEDSAKRMENITVINKLVSNWMSIDSQYYSDLAKIGHTFQNISEFEISPILARYFQACDDTISKVVIIHQGTHERQSIEVCTRLLYMSRYVGCYRSALLHRSKVVCSLQQACKREKEAKNYVNFLISRDNCTYSGYHKEILNEYKEDSKRNHSAVEVKELPDESSTLIIENITSKRKAKLQKQNEDNDRTINTKDQCHDKYDDDVDEEECNWQQERKLHFEDQLNTAKLKLLVEEDCVEKLKVDESKLTKRLKKECKLMEDKGNTQLLGSMVALIQCQIKSSHDNVILWESLRQHLSSAI